MDSKIFTDGVLIDLRIRYWSGRKKLAAEDLNLPEDSVPDIFSLGSKYLVPKEIIGQFAKLGSRGRSFLEDASFKFPVGNTRYALKKHIPDITQRLDEIKFDFEQEIERFLNDYDVIREEMLNNYSEYRDSLEPFYPQVEQLEQKFEFNYILFEITTPNKVKGVTTAQLMAQQNAYNNYVDQLNKQMDNFLNDVVIEMRGQVTELCGKIVKNISNGKVVKEKSIESLRKLVDKFSDFNFVGDKNIEEKLQNLRENWLQAGAINENGLDEFKETLQEVVAAASDISDISDITGGYKRKIRVA